MEQAERRDNSTTQWCCNLPLIEQLPLSAQERNCLRRAARRHLWLGIAAYVSPPFTFIGGILFFFAIFGSDGPPPAVTGISLLLCALPLILAKDQLTRASGLRGDLRAGQKLRFAGMLDQQAYEELLLKQLYLRGYLEFDSGQEQCVEVLPHSKRIWLVNGRTLPGWHITTISTTANAPEIAAIAAQWLDPVGEIDGHTIHAGQRELSAEEKAELRRYAKASWRQLLLSTILLTIWWTTILLLSIHARRLPQGGEGVMFIILTVGTVVTLFRFVSRCRLARRILRDVRYGIVIITRASRQDAMAAEPAPTDDLNEKTVESLPFSSMAWTIEGQPLPWRKQYDPRQ